MTPEEEIRRGEEAAALISNPLFIEALGMLKKEVIDTWGACPARDTHGREWLWLMYQNAMKFEEVLKTVINSGKMSAQVAREKTMADRLLNVVRR